jgi:hypothetical protein
MIREGENMATNEQQPEENFKEKVKNLLTSIRHSFRGKD